MSAVKVIIQNQLCDIKDYGDLWLVDPYHLRLKETRINISNADAKPGSLQVGEVLIWIGGPKMGTK